MSTVKEAGMTPERPLALEACRWRKKPVVIEAFQFWGWTGSAHYMPRWFMTESTACAEGVEWRCEGANIVWESHEPNPKIACIIKTLEGEMRADIGDWIIKGVKGEIYPCKPDIFAMSYEPESLSRAGADRQAELVRMMEKIEYEISPYLHPMTANETCKALAESIVAKFRAALSPQEGK